MGPHFCCCFSWFPWACVCKCLMSTDFLPNARGSGHKWHSNGLCRSCKTRMWRFNYLGTKMQVWKHSQIDEYGWEIWQMLAHGNCQFVVWEDQELKVRTVVWRNNTTYITTVSKRGATFTNVWPFSIVHCFDMRLEAAFLRKSSCTASIRTQKRFLSKMDSFHMTVQIGFLTKQSPTSRFRAREISFA